MIVRALTLVALLGAGFVAGFATARGTPADPIKTGVIHWDDIKVENASWGEARTTFTGETYGVKDLLTIYLTIEPGKAAHKSHQHAEEEFMILTDGEGTWSLNGKDVPAKKGDVVYTAPWDFHGLTNTSDKPLTFFVVKWGYKGLKNPKKP